MERERKEEETGQKRITFWRLVGWKRKSEESGKEGREGKE